MFKNGRKGKFDAICPHRFYLSLCKYCSEVPMLSFNKIEVTSLVEMLYQQYVIFFILDIKKNFSLLRWHLLRRIEMTIVLTS